MSRSTARFISYDLRPAKQSERRILIDVLKTGGDCGFPIVKYRYVGMGANRFYDFLLIHKYLGISSMISLEHDPVMHSRAVFNVPYSFIDIRQMSVGTFLAEDRSEEPTIYWLDYDGGIGGSIVRDIASIGMNLKVGDFCFVTVYGGPPRFFDKENDQDRLIWLQDNLGAVSGNLDIKDMENANFPSAVHKILLSAFQNAGAPRRDGKFFPLFRVSYSDTAPMVTVGGAFLQNGQAVDYHRRLQDNAPFLFRCPGDLYEIASLNITERERHLFDRAVTAPNKRNAARKKLKELGFTEREFRTYGDLVRYFPRYVETMV